MLYVNNAKDFLSKAERDAHTAEKKQEFESFGFDFYELDLRDYFDPTKHPVLAEILKETDLLWLGGGNTFLLRRAMAYSGLDTMASELLKQNAFVYGGSSAGSIVTTKTLHGTDHGDDPYQIVDGYKEEIVWDGLGLIYLQLVPHFNSEWFAKESKAMVNALETLGLKYETLEDGQVYIVDGDYEEKLS